MHATATPSNGGKRNAVGSSKKATPASRASPRKKLPEEATITAQERIDNADNDINSTAESAKEVLNICSDVWSCCCSSGLFQYQWL